LSATNLDKSGSDISGYFDAIVRTLLIEMIEKRVSDGGILRLIGNGLNAAVFTDRIIKSEKSVSVT
jgi:hypothetical protein